MILSDFRTRVRNRLRDTASQFSDTLIWHTLDECIITQQALMSKAVPNYYLASTTYIGVTNAEGSSNDERYTLPSDFRNHIALRRTDVVGNPPLRYVPIGDIDKYRYMNLHPVIDDSFTLKSAFQYWTLYDSNSLIVVPAPASTSETFRLDYIRKHVTADADGETVDIPDAAIPYMVTFVAWTLLLEEGDANSDRLKEKLSIDRQDLVGYTQFEYASQAVEVQKWW